QLLPGDPLLEQPSKGYRRLSGVDWSDPGRVGDPFDLDDRLVWKVRHCATVRHVDDMDDPFTSGNRLDEAANVFTLERTDARVVGRTLVENRSKLVEIRGARGRSRGVVHWFRCGRRVTEVKRSLEAIRHG